jgi:hypothetical protein
MPQKIISKFQKKYGKKKGKNIYYATANKQGRDPETFHKESFSEKLGKILEGQDPGQTRLKGGHGSPNPLRKVKPKIKKNV